MDLRLNATRRSLNLSVYLVFDLEAGRFKFWVKICLALDESIFQVEWFIATLFSFVGDQTKTSARSSLGRDFESRNL